MQFDKQKVQKGGNTRIKVVSNKVFFRTWREKKARSFFSSQGDENLSNSDERGMSTTRCTKADQEIYIFIRRAIHNRPMKQRIMEKQAICIHSIMRKITSAK